VESEVKVQLKFSFITAELGIVVGSLRVAVTFASKEFGLNACMLVGKKYAKTKESGEVVIDGFVDIPAFVHAAPAELACKNFT
jgi:hypothetical protein